MQELINPLSVFLFQKPLLQCSSEEVAATANKFPYYPITQLLYAFCLKESNPEKYLPQLQKTSLYFNNPLWLHGLIAKQTPPQPVTEKENNPVPVYEDFNNDELVVVNPVYEFTAEKFQLQEASGLPTPTSPLQKVETPLLFEPYHTIDYFASQGIKPIEEVKPGDRFGQQLKSFTEWLKTLKTSESPASLPTPDNNADDKVIHLAGNSLEDNEVATESMAAVWIKQGHPEKALAIYEKLSLLNPAKSSYFAGLIEKLKQQ